MNKETIVTSAFRVHRSQFSCSLAAALLGKRHVPACQGWAGEKSELFEHPAQLFSSYFIPDLSAIEMLQ